MRNDNRQHYAWQVHPGLESRTKNEANMLARGKADGCVRADGRWGREREGGRARPLECDSMGHAWGRIVCRSCGNLTMSQAHQNLPATEVRF